MSWFQSGRFFEGLGRRTAAADGGLGRRYGAEKQLMPMRFLAALAAILIMCGASAVGVIAADKVYDSHGKRNPFIPSSQIASSAAQDGGVGVDTSALEAWFGQNLGGIIWDAENPYALIQDEIVPVGGEVQGCTIVAIRPGGIVFLYGGRRVEVPLKESKKEGKKKEKDKDAHH